MLTDSLQKPAATPALLDVGQLAELLNCSKRHAVRMSDAGRLPRPIRFGSLVRWRRDEIEGWLRDGCPRVRP